MCIVFTASGYTAGLVGALRERLLKSDRGAAGAPLQGFPLQGGTPFGDKIITAVRTSRRPLLAVISPGEAFH